MTTKVLIVDDALTVRRFLREVFSELDVEVIEASDGNEGLELALAQRPDLAFVDVNMPAIDGFTLVRRLRARAETRRLPIVVLTAESSPEDERRAYAAGASYFLAKPPTDAVLRSLVEVLGARP